MKVFLRNLYIVGEFIKDHILDTKNGEWFWGVRENYEVMNEDKVGIWKCPYHNSRACIELIKRIDNATPTTVKDCILSLQINIPVFNTEFFMVFDFKNNLR